MVSPFMFTDGSRVAGGYTLSRHGNRDRPWLHGAVLSAPQYALWDSCLSAPSTGSGVFASALLYGCPPAFPVHPSHPRRQCLGSSCYNLGHARLEQTRGVGERLHHRVGHSSGSCTVRTWPCRRLSDSPR